MAKVNKEEYGFTLKMAADKAFLDVCRRTNELSRIKLDIDEAELELQLASKEHEARVQRLVDFQNTGKVR